MHFFHGGVDVHFSLFILFNLFVCVCLVWCTNVKENILPFMVSFNVQLVEIAFSSIIYHPLDGDGSAFINFCSF